MIGEGQRGRPPKIRCRGLNGRATWSSLAPKLTSGDQLQPLLGEGEGEGEEDEELESDYDFAQGAALHPVTLVFASSRLEGSMRAEQTSSSYEVSMGCCFFFLVTHAIIWPAYPKARTVPIIYVPLIIAFLVLRYRINREANMVKAHQQLERLWTVLVLIGTAAQRGAMALGFHNRMGADEAVLVGMYHFHWTMVVVTLHLQLVSFSHRLVVMTAIFLSLATPGRSHTPSRESRTERCARTPAARCTCGEV